MLSNGDIPYVRLVSFFSRMFLIDALSLQSPFPIFPALNAVPSLRMSSVARSAHTTVEVRMVQARSVS